jgi:hypothetical protein
LHSELCFYFYNRRFRNICFQTNFSFVLTTFFKIVRFFVVPQL